MGIDDIIKKIRTDASNKVESLRKEALEEKEKIIEEARKEADKVREDIINRFRKEAEAEKMGMVIRARMEEKKKLLSLKRELMSEAFKQAEKELSNLDREEYLKLMKELLIRAVDSEDEEVLVSPRDEAWMRTDFMDEVRKKLNDRIGGSPPLSPKLDEGERGFILKKKGIQINYTFSALFASLKEKLEIEVARMLFSP